MTQNNRIILRVMLLILLAAGVASVAAAQPPIVANDNYSVNVNTFLNVPVGSGLFFNDVFNALTHRLEAFDRVSQFGGSVFVAPDGAFTYEPAPGFRGLDSFTYTVRAAGGASTAIVYVDVTGTTVWFVDDSAPAGGDGTINAPFDSFAPVNDPADIDAPGETIFVYEGNYNVNLILEPGQSLIGHAEGLDLFGTANDVPPGAAPVLTGGSAPIVTLSGANNVVRGFSISNTLGKAILGSGVSEVALQNIDITTSATSTGGVEFINTSGTITVTDLHITGSTAVIDDAIRIISNSGTINFVNSTVSSFTGGRVLLVSANSGAVAFDSASDLTSTDTAGLGIETQTSTGVVTLAGINLTGGVDTEPLVSLLNNHATSTVNFAEGLTAHATAVDSAALNDNGGRLTIGGTTSALVADDGPALELEDVELTANATIASLTSALSNTRGVSISDPVGNFDITVTGTTTITDPATEAIVVESTVSPNFALLLARLVVASTPVGIVVDNARVDVTDNTSTLTTSAGAAVSCTDGTTNLAFATLTAVGGVNGISFDTCAGTVTAAAGSLASTAGATNHVVNIDSSTVSLTYGGTINKTNAGRAVRIDGLTNPGAAAFNGTVTASNASGGVQIANSARPVTFTTLTLGASGARFAATPVTLAGNTGAVDLGVFSSFTNNDEALVVSYANASPGQVTTDAGSVLDAAGATAALVVGHGTGQPLNLTFASITNSGAGTHGININRGSGTLTVSGLTNLGAKTIAGIEIANSSLTTSLQEVDIAGALDGVRLASNSGSFTITGDGSASTYTNGAGGTFTNLTDNAFDLATVTNIAINDVTVNGTGGHGVTGTGVSNATFSNVDMDDIGNANDENVFNFQQGAVSGAQLTGAVSINNSVITDFADNGLYLENFSGSLNLRIEDNVFEDNISTTACGGGNCDGAGLLIRADGTASIVALIDDNDFNQIDGIGITANPEGNSGATMDLTISLNNFVANVNGGMSNTNNGETAISLRNAQGNSDLEFNIQNNIITNYTAEFALGVIEVEAGDFANTDGFITGNTINHANFGNAIQLFADGANTTGGGTTDFDLTASVTGNTIPGGAPLFGVALLLQNNGATVVGSDVNTNVTVQGNNFGAVPTGTSRRTMTFNVRDTHDACFNVTGNTVAAGTGGTQSSLNLSYNGTGAVRVQGMVGTGSANAVTFFNSNNTLGVGAVAGTNDNAASATCATPTMPTTPP